ncbi:heavy metal sensor signal transduction histidine kinase [Duganella sacchari]|uniref:Sensor protein n=1 Tax=Duganella sacchari TaxID=551987 RepID=A0A1M7KSC6_9BURK|nr:heavy metal sensor histidine kinase [Duganella sacchari]SHM68365.1 heavy metal sensor signal transduction histidine kinase [Duganella sacchari]
MSSKNDFKPMALIGERGSIAFRLTVWYALLSVVLIASAGSILYLVLADRLRQEDDQWLAGRIAEVRGILLLHSRDFAALQEEVHREAAMLPGSYLRVVDAQGVDVVEAPPPHAAEDGRPFADPRFRAGGDEQGMDWASGSGETYRLMYARVGIDGGFTVQAAMNRTSEEEVLAAYRRILWLALSASLAIAVIAGYLIARRGLQPVSRLAAIIAELSAAHLHRRVADDDWPRELRPLAANFDQLLVRLDESFARISRFSADIAHELRTPLHILQGEAEMALSKDRSNEQYRDCIASATEEYERLTRMVDALLFLARTEQPDSLPNKQTLDLEQEIAAVCAFYQALADEQDTTLIAGGVGTVLADSALLRRALGNLIINALRHTPSGGSIVVDVAKTPDHGVDIVVSDTGEGIAPEDLPHVFDRFYRADSARLRQGTGTGLGLAIVRSILLLHGGSVSLDSELGCGTAATLRFPAS